MTTADEHGTNGRADEVAEILAVGYMRLLEARRKRNRQEPDNLDASLSEEKPL